MLDNPFWKKSLRFALISVIAAPLIAVPILVMAVVHGPPIPVKVAGTIGSTTENIGFSGQMTVATRMIGDPDFRGPTILELTVDFSNVKGVGMASGRKFVSEAQTVIHRPLLAFDTIELTFPYTPGNDVHLAQTATATINVTFSAASGLGLTSKITKTSSNGSGG